MGLRAGEGKEETSDAEQKSPRKSLKPETVQWLTEGRDKSPGWQTCPPSIASCRRMTRRATKAVRSSSTQGHFVQMAAWFSYRPQKGGPLPNRGPVSLPPAPITSATDSQKLSPWPSLLALLLFPHTCHSNRAFSLWK